VIAAVADGMGCGYFADGWRLTKEAPAPALQNTIDQTALQADSTAAAQKILIIEEFLIFSKLKIHYSI